MAMAMQPTIRGFPLQLNTVHAACGDPVDNAAAANAIVGNGQNIGVIGHLCLSGMRGALPIYQAQGSWRSRARPLPTTCRDSARPCATVRSSVTATVASPGSIRSWSCRRSGRGISTRRDSRRRRSDRLRRALLRRGEVAPRPAPAGAGHRQREPRDRSESARARGASRAQPPRRDLHDHPQRQYRQRRERSGASNPMCRLTELDVTGRICSLAGPPRCGQPEGSTTDLGIRRSELPVGTKRAEKPSRRFELSDSRSLSQSQGRGFESFTAHRRSGLPARSALGGAAADSRSFFVP